MAHIWLEVCHPVRCVVTSREDPSDLIQMTLHPSAAPGPAGRTCGAKVTHQVQRVDEQSLWQSVWGLSHVQIRHSRGPGPTISASNVSLVGVYLGFAHTTVGERSTLCRSQHMITHGSRWCDQLGTWHLTCYCPTCFLQRSRYLRCPPRLQ